MTASLIVRRRNAGLSPEPVVLILNSDPSARRWIEATVTSIGLHAESFESAEQLLSGFAGDTPACAILDPASHGASIFDVQQELYGAGASVVFLTGEHSISSCVRALKGGAADFLTMPCSAAELVQALRYAIRQALSLRARREQLSELRRRFDLLTPREQEVFALVASGMLNKQIAQLLSISDITVQIHRGRVMRKMRAQTFAALVRMADALQFSPQQCCTSRLSPTADLVFAPHPQQIAHCLVEQ